MAQTVAASPEHPLIAGEPVVDFALTGVDGRRYDSRTARSAGPLLYAIYKKGCGTCQYTMPFLQRFAEQYAGDDCHIWGISQDTPDETRDLAAEQGLTFPLLLDSDLSVSLRHGLTHVPGIYLVDASDRILRNAPAFIKAEINAMAEEVAKRTGKPYRPVVRDEDDAPALRPG